MLLVKLWWHFAAGTIYGSSWSTQRSSSGISLLYAWNAIPDSLARIRSPVRGILGLGVECSASHVHSASGIPATAHPKDAEKTFTGEHEHTVHRLVNHVVS
jgi:hypothetical protein